MSLNLYNANKQWSERPDDERFSTVEEMSDACEQYRKMAVCATVARNSLSVVPDGNEVMLLGENKQKARMTHWAFGQMCSMVGAPASYLRTLRAETAAQALNESLARKTFMNEENTARIMFHRNGHLLARAITSEGYKRIWNADVCKGLERLKGNGWMVPPARPATPKARGVRLATKDDVMTAGKFALSVKVGDLIAPAGLYASDHDMFAFMVDPRREVVAGVKGAGGLFRGFFVWNSETGSSSWGIMTFLWRHVCGNHIVWDAENVKEIRIRHVGRAPEKAIEALGPGLKAYAEESDAKARQQVTSAQRFKLGTEKFSVMDSVRKLSGAGVLDTGLAWDTAVEHESQDGDPTSVWGMVNGFTRLSQLAVHGDRRVALERTAGDLLKVAAS